MRICTPKMIQSIGQVHLNDWVTFPVRCRMALGSQVLWYSWSTAKWTALSKFNDQFVARDVDYTKLKFISNIHRNSWHDRIKWCSQLSPRIHSVAYFASSTDELISESQVSRGVNKTDLRNHPAKIVKSASGCINRSFCLALRLWAIRRFKQRLYTHAIAKQYKYYL